MTKTIENFLRYAKIDTQSNEESVTTPSTGKQHDLAKLLTQELETMGAEEVFYDTEHCYVYGSIPATVGCTLSTVGCTDAVAVQKFSLSVTVTTYTFPSETNVVFVTSPVPLHL